MFLHHSNSSKQCDIAMLNNFGISTFQLMEVAGKAVAEVILENACFSFSKNVFVFCGHGNNGGDGIVAARYLLTEGFCITVYLLGDSEKYGGALLENFLQIKRMLDTFPKMLSIKVLPTIDQIERDFYQCKPSLILDGIFGVGLKNNVSGYFAEIISWINNKKSTVISIDIPSGINADNGQMMGCAVKAFATVTFSTAKIGHFIYPGKEFCGKLIIRNIGIPRPFIDDNSQAFTFSSYDEVKEHLIPRPRDSHKGNFGAVYLMGGSSIYQGALKLSLLSALCAGAGKVFASYHLDDHQYFSSLPDECIHFPVQSPDDFKKILSDRYHPDFTILCIGPGISREDKKIEIIKQLYLEWDGKMLIDADGLYAIKDIIQQFKHPSSLILTPHLGEMSMLTGLSVESIKKDLFSIASDYANNWNCTIVLKSSSTIVASPGQQSFIQSFGNSGMAKAGTGDVLAGIIAGFAAQGNTLHYSAILGTSLHSIAGDIASKELSEWSVMASDLIRCIPKAFQSIA